MMAKPPAAFTSGDSLMSVPRPAMFVAMVTAPSPLVDCPAFATMDASFWCCLALSTSWSILRMLSILLSNSDISTDVVPTSTGRPCLRRSSISSITAAYFSLAVLYTRSSMSLRAMGRLVGISTTSSLYMSQNSPASVDAVPVIPASLWYIRK